MKNNPSKMSVEEKQQVALTRIADYMKSVGQICFFVFLGIAVLALIYLVLIISPSVYQYVYYDLLENDRPDWYYYPTIDYVEPIDDCSYSNDPQLCFQMERLADFKELELISMVDGQ